MPSPRPAPAAWRRRSLLALSAAGAACGLLATLGCTREDAAIESFDIRPEDIDYFRRSRAEWLSCESGVPAIVPYGISLADFTDAIYFQREWPGSDRFVKLATAFFLHAGFTARTVAFDPPFKGRSAFDVTNDHIQLLRHTSWELFAVQCRRPYGDSTYHEADMAQLLGLPVGADERNHVQLAPAVLERMGGLHNELLYVVEAYIRSARLTPGRYAVPGRGLSLEFSRPLCRPVSPERMAAYERAARTSSSEPEARRKRSMEKAAAALFSPD